MLFRHYSINIDNSSLEIIERALMQYAVAQMGTNVLTLVYNRLKLKDPREVYGGVLMRQIVDEVKNSVLEGKEYKVYEYEDYFVKDINYCKAKMNPQRKHDVNEFEKLLDDMISVLIGTRGKLQTRQADMNILHLFASDENSSRKEEVWSATLYKNTLTFRLNDKYKNVKVEFVL